MCPNQRRIKLNQLTNRYRYAFYLFGPLGAGYNRLRLASFLSTKKPHEYEVFIEDDQKALVFWNPHEKAQIKQS